MAANYNVTSLTDNGVGDFTVNFTTAFSSINYALEGCGTTLGDGSGPVTFGFDVTVAPAAASCRVNVKEGNNKADNARFSCSFQGDQ